MVRVKTGAPAAALNSTDGSIFGGNSSGNSGAPTLVNSLDMIFDAVLQSSDVWM